MRVLLTVCIALTISVALSSAYCKRAKLHLNIKAKSRGCIDQGTFHKINSKWTNKCEVCVCSESGMECCDSTPIPSNFDKEACHSEFDEETCTYKVSRKDNPSIPCEVKSMKG